MSIAIASDIVVKSFAYCCCWDYNMTLSVASFNVHMWVDGEWECNKKRVLEIVKAKNPDVLCLQESDDEYDQMFAESAGYKHFASKGTRAIFSKWKIKEVYDGNGKWKDEEISQAHRGLSVKERVNRRSFPFLTVAIDDPQRSGDPSSTVYVTCLHLDYRDETIRLKEIRTIKQKLDSLLPQPETIASSMHIWAGDFNALTKENYNGNQWSQITKVRLDNKWESPQRDVMQEVKFFGMIDCWGSADEDVKLGPLKTCRFDTRIDYILLNATMLNTWVLKQIETVDDNASDHNMVIVHLSRVVN